MATKKLIQHQSDSYDDNLNGSTNRSGENSLSFYWNGSTWLPTDGSTSLTVNGNPVSATNPVPIMPPLIGYLKTMEQGTLVPASYDYISQTQASLTDVWVFKSGGVSGTTVGTITITYTGTDKQIISTVIKT